MPENFPKSMMEGSSVFRFQRRMELDSRVLDGHSIIGCLSVPGVADRINEQIKFRECWRPSMLSTAAPQIELPSHFITCTFEDKGGREERVTEVEHEEGTFRAEKLKWQHDAHWCDEHTLRG